LAEGEGGPAGADCEGEGFWGGHCGGRVCLLGFVTRDWELRLSVGEMDTRRAARLENGQMLEIVAEVRIANRLLVVCL
jgi:hypothetical protein